MNLASLLSFTFHPPNLDWRSCVLCEAMHPLTLSSTALVDQLVVFSSPIGTSYSGAFTHDS